VLNFFVWFTADEFLPQILNCETGSLIGSGTDQMKDLIVQVPAARPTAIKNITLSVI
jgi:hypothetical protein